MQKSTTPTAKSDSLEGELFIHPVVKAGVFVGLTHEGSALVCPVGVIDRAGANELADRMTLQASKLRRFALTG